VDDSGSGLCPIVSFGFSDVEHPGSSAATINSLWTPHLISVTHFKRNVSSRSHKSQPFGTLRSFR
jgi:hypothetical protein